MVVIGREGVHNQAKLETLEWVYHQVGRVSYLWNSFSALSLSFASFIFPIMGHTTVGTQDHVRTRPRCAKKCHLDRDPIPRPAERE